jgi:hypothetical protein
VKHSKERRVSRLPAFFIFSHATQKSDRFYSSTHHGHHGSPGDIPRPADLDGDGLAELVVYRPSEGIWYSLNIMTQEFTAIHFGLPSDIPVTGDYDSDGKADRAVYRPSDGTWYILQSRLGFTAFRFGSANDIPLPATAMVYPTSLSSAKAYGIYCVPGRDFSR